MLRGLELEARRVGDLGARDKQLCGRGGLEAGVTGKKGFPRLYKKRICMERWVLVEPHVDD